MQAWCILSVLGRRLADQAFSWEPERFGSWGAQGEISRLGRHDGSMLTMVLEETGQSASLFASRLTVWFRTNMRVLRSPAVPQYWKSHVLATFSGSLGLFTSYLFTHGFWIPFTWILLAFNTAALARARPGDELFGRPHSQPSQASNGASGHRVGMGVARTPSG